jgi:tetratricopeptide (TPR) repeat protein
MRRRLGFLVIALSLGGPAMAVAVDVDALWNYNQPAESEARFRAALKEAQGDDALVLRTQIARTYSLRGRFDDAHRELDALAPALAKAGPEPKVRALLERGRTLRSARQPAEARPLFLRAFDEAQAAGLQALAGDALHMVALVEPDVAGQIEWNRRTADYARAASDPKARRWEAPALANLVVALNEAGRHEEALPAAREAEAAYERRGQPDDIAYARWMVAHTLRLLKRHDEALALLLQMERDADARHAPDADTYEELAAVYEAKGDATQAARYKAMQAQLSGK